MSPAPVSQAFIEVMQQVDRVADTNVPVLLIGESEIGRALIASTIHHRSSRRDRPFVTVDCVAIPPESIEAQVFDQGGLWEEADGGTIFFDQITETTTSFQRRLLAALQTGEIALRALAGTNRDLEQEVAAGTFSSELFGYLNGTSIVLPPLRERAEQIPANDDWVTLSVIEGRYVARVLEHTGGNKQAAARLLAVDRKTLDRMIKRHHIDSNHVKALRAKASSRT
jgi:DNA-binding NtrC family response regulator